MWPFPKKGCLTPDDIFHFIIFYWLVINGILLKRIEFLFICKNSNVLLIFINMKCPWARQLTWNLCECSKQYLRQLFSQCSHNIGKTNQSVLIAILFYRSILFSENCHTSKLCLCTVLLKIIKIFLIGFV